ncbi:MAG: VIT and vWA domain-containing protein [Kiritimatiellia bacterium]
MQRDQRKDAVLRKLTGVFVTVVGMSLGPVAGADGLIVIHRPPPEWRPPPHVPYQFAPLEVKYHKVEVKITDQLAVTAVDQSFYNPNPQRLEGDYIFPIPQGAQIDKFSMDIDGKMVEAELLDAEKARKMYEDIVRKLKDPALLEYSSQSLFRVRIFPIEPHSEKRIRMKYTELLRRESGLVAYTYPLNTEKFSAQPIKTVAIKIELECSEPISTVYCPSHSAEIKRDGSRRAVIGYETSNARPDTDFQLYYATESKSDVGVRLLAFNDGSDAEGGYFCLFASPTPALAKEKIVQKDLVFVLDTSGSMAEGGKLEQAKRALTFCLKNLNEGDRFEVVRFSTEAEALFGKLVEATAENRRRAEEFIKGLKPMGGTAIEEALRKAFAPAEKEAAKDRPYMVAFLTDGKPTIGATNEKELLEVVTNSSAGRLIRVFCFGLGADVNTHLLDRIAEKTRSATQYVLPKEDIEVKVSNFYAKINDPVLTGLKLDFSSKVKVSKLHPAALPDLFKGEELVVFGRYSGAGDVAVGLEGVVNGERRKFIYEAAFPEKATQHDFIPRLWATRRVGFLLNEIRLRGEDRELRDECAELARRYGIVTPYTAYLIVEEESKRNVPLGQRALPVLARDEAFKAEGRRIYRGLGAEKSGEAAVGNAMALDSLSSARTLAAPDQANAYVRAGQGTAAASLPPSTEQLLDGTLTRVVAGRTFYKNGAQWVDALIQTRPNATRVRIEFGSDQYFELLRKSPSAAPWLSVGRNVQLLLEDTIYEIVEKLDS